MKLIRNITALLALAGFVSAANADYTYTQDFNGMGTGTTLPTGWTGYNITGTHDQFKPTDDPMGTGGLPTSSAILGGTSVTTVTAATASNQKSAATLYNWAIGGSTTERALGTSPTGNAAMVLQAVLTNTDGPVTDLSISYDVRVLSTTVMNNSYAGNNYSSGTVEELPGYWLWYSLDGGATYTNVASLNGDGHTWANVIGTVHETVADLTLSSTWASGASLYLRWVDDNAQGPSPDQLLGLDNVVINSVSVPEPASLAVVAMGGIALLTRRRRA